MKYKYYGKGIDKIKKAKVKKSLIEGKTAKQALLDAGYSKATARKSTLARVVKECQSEIIQGIRKKISEDYIISNLLQDRDLALAKEDYSTATRINELLGKYLSMFSDKLKLQNDLPQEDEQSINQRRNRLINMIRDTYNNEN